MAITRESEDEGRDRESERRPASETMGDWVEKRESGRWNTVDAPLETRAAVTAVTAATTTSACTTARSSSGTKRPARRDKESVRSDVEERKRKRQGGLKEAGEMTAPR